MKVVMSAAPGGRVTAAGLPDEQYRELLAFRTALRRFLRWSEQQAEAAGVTGQQHQLLLAIRGHDGPDAPTVGDVAEHLLLRHHSAVELVDRAAEAGLVRRLADADDGRLVRLELTPRGRDLLERLSAAHLEELARLAPIVQRLAAGLPSEGAERPAVSEGVRWPRSSAVARPRRVAGWPDGQPPARPPRSCARVVRRSARSWPRCPMLAAGTTPAACARCCRRSPASGPPCGPRASSASASTTTATPAGTKGTRRSSASRPGAAPGAVPVRRPRRSLPEAARPAGTAQDGEGLPLPEAARRRRPGDPAPARRALGPRPPRRRPGQHLTLGQGGRGRPDVRPARGRIRPSRRWPRR